jgi:hypothetical protein
VARVASGLRAHPRLAVALQLTLLAVLIGAVAWVIRGSFHAAGDDLKDANAALFALACLAVTAYYLVFVLGWMKILADWGIRISYPTSLNVEIVSMLAKYIPGGVWTPAARIVAMRRAGVTDSPLVGAAMFVEAGLSALAGVLVFAVSLLWVHGVDGPLYPLAAFALVLAIMLHPRMFHWISSKIFRRFGFEDVPPLRGSTLVGLLLFYAGTWLIGGLGLWLLLWSVGSRPPVWQIVYLGGVSAVGAIVAVLAFFAPSGLGAREGSMYGLMLAVTSSGAALSASLLNRVAITVVEVLLLVAGALVLRRKERRALAPQQP